MPKNAGNLIFELHFFKNFLGGMPPDPPRKQVPLALAIGRRMLAYKSPRFSLGFPVFQSPSTSFTEVRVGSPVVLSYFIGVVDGVMLIN